ncbi:hypothetical protein A2801_00610 [Candidatus Woesebacteria bacterium RIFCSPHIGHO2_01_FULL_41_10]|uniref:Uncharacterized protein n=1 Tax=Candidatus Woesebacteria bacterium RIFCSPHIGHO2_01_FULL_41_10 TaxID=1802500 RepID=A0A1F7YSK6_9BACT|nr:MAG: hypothetical protein A2801_00610 [Candidatus Woesebacteria bacterium RIFCSPHIGHO2_01_FULL_41_10]
MKKALLLIPLVIVIVTIGVIVWVQSAYSIPLPTTFESCIASGGTMTKDTLPRECVLANGSIFVETAVAENDLFLQNLDLVGYVGEHFVFDLPRAWVVTQNSSIDLTITTDNTLLSPIFLGFTEGNIEDLRAIENRPSDISGQGFFFAGEVQGLKRNKLSDDELTLTYEYYLPGRNQSEVLKLMVDVKNVDDNTQMREVEALLDQLMSSVRYDVTS